MKTYYEIEAEIKTNNTFVLKEMEKMGKTFWISRVTSTITEAKDLLTANLSLNTLKSDDRYSFYETFVDYGGVKQKWVLLLSHSNSRSNRKHIQLTGLLI